MSELSLNNYESLLFSQKFEDLIADCFFVQNEPVWLFLSTLILSLRAVQRQRLDVL